MEDIQESLEVSSLNLSIKSLPFEIVPSGEIRGPILQAKDRNFADKETNVILALGTMDAQEHAEDTLRLSMLEMKSVRSQYISPKANDSVLNDTPAHEVVTTHTDFPSDVVDNREAPPSPEFPLNYAKWRRLALVAKSVQRFRSPIVERIRSAVNLKRSVTSSSPSRLHTLNNGIMYITPGHIQSEALNEFRDHAVFFKALQRGDPEDLELVKAFLLHDPKRNLYDPDSTNRLVNKPDSRGYTPLYMACRDGNLPLVKLLIEFQANPYQPCQFGEDIKETALDVAARWGHVEIIKYFTSNKFLWARRDLKKASEEARNDEIKGLIKRGVGKKKSLIRRILHLPTKS